jgi:hypothetical protein
MQLGELYDLPPADGSSLIIAVDTSCQEQEIVLVVYPKEGVIRRVAGPDDVQIVSRFHRVSTSSGTEKPLAIRLQGTCSMFGGRHSSTSWFCSTTMGSFVVLTTPKWPLF